MIALADNLPQSTTSMAKLLITFFLLLENLDSNSAFVVETFLVEKILAGIIIRIAIWQEAIFF